MTYASCIAQPLNTNAVKAETILPASSQMVNSLVTLDKDGRERYK